MSNTKYFTERVEIDVGLDEWDDSELIDEMKARGYTVDDEDIENVQYCWNRGQKKEALILLERKFKWLRGVSDLMN